MREVLLHGSSDAAFDRSVAFARRLAESFGARLHVVYTVEEPLSAGWTAEVSAERMPEVHEAIETEARERLARLIPETEQEQLGIQLALRTGPAATELIRYTKEHNIDIAIVYVPPEGGSGGDLARTLIDDARCSVLVLR